MKVVKKAGHNVAHQPSHLEKLPELRNLIYDFLIADLTHGGLPIRAYHRGDVVKRRMHKFQRRSPHSFRAVLALMHVNSQIRAEWRPLVLAKVPIEIHLSATRAYIHSFFRHTTSQDDTVLKGQLHITFMTKDRDHFESRRADLTPLIELAINSPEVVYNLRVPGNVLHEMVVKNRRAWISALKYDIASIGMEDVFFGAHVTLVFKHTSWAPPVEELEKQRFFVPRTRLGYHHSPPRKSLELYMRHLGWQGNEDNWHTDISVEQREIDSMIG
ncbi:hypothetical protein NX059_012073 [Plenodomus lindquistii]|nr:hypothetical protein NX059_012073 [Plenodomus lindquistii]